MPADCVSFIAQAAAGIGFNAAHWYQGGAREADVYLRRDETLRPVDPDVFSIPQKGLPEPSQFARKYTATITNPFDVAWIPIFPGHTRR